VALLAIGGAAFFIFQSDRQTDRSRAAARAFDQYTRETVDLLADLRAAQQAYVAEGQAGSFWTAKVDGLARSAAKNVTSLHEMATSAAAKAALEEATSTIADFQSVDKRARDYLKSGQSLMAGDVIFTEGGQTATTAGRKVETARLAEYESADRLEAAAQKDRLVVLGGAVALTGIVILVLALRPQPSNREAEAPTHASRDTLGLSKSSAGRGTPATAPAPAPPIRPVSEVLRAAADLCTDFGRVRNLSDLQTMLGRAADAMSATGVVVWMSNPPGSDLSPVIAHGYRPQALARMPSVPRSADNAAAAAYRSGELRIVMSRPGGAPGAIVAPIFSSEGCVGALSAEIRGGGEASESVQAMATLVAAQLSTILAPAPVAESPADTARAVASS
jgi:hypothetical protein